MNLSKRTLILLAIGVLLLIAAVFSARTDEEPEEIDGPDIVEIEDEEPEDAPGPVIVPEAEPAEEPRPDIPTFNGAE